MVLLGPHQGGPRCTESPGEAGAAAEGQASVPPVLPAHRSLVQEATGPSEMILDVRWVGVWGMQYRE